VALGGAPDVKSAIRKPARLLWIHQNFVGDDQVGNRRAGHVLQAFRSHGWTVDVIAPHSSYLEVAPNDLGSDSTVEERDGITVHRLRTRGQGAAYKRRRRSYLDFLWRAYWRAWRLPRPDLLFVSSPPLPQVALAMALAAWWRRPMILEVRDLWPAFLLELKLVRRTPLVLLLEWFEAFAYRYADRCVVVSPPFAGYLEGMGVPRTRLAIVPSGGDPRLAEGDGDAGRHWRDEHDLDQQLLFVYAGSFNEAYDLESVLDAADTLATSRPDVVWLFAGDGRQREMLVSRAASSDHVRYLGALSKRDLWPLLHAADAGIVTLEPTPLLRTVIPGKLLEYLTAGLPVLAWAGGQAASILRTSRAGVTLDSDKPHDVADALREFVELPASERRAMGQAGRKWVLANMRADVLALRAAVVADEALAHPRPGARGRFLVGSVAALWDAARHRSQRALRDLSGSDAESIIQRSFESWLASSSDRSHVSVNPLLERAALPQSTHRVD
jgi:glycosyltransferase involved in cell wall biosynthesis